MATDVEMGFDCRGDAYHMFIYISREQQCRTS